MLHFGLQKIENSLLSLASKLKFHFLSTCLVIRSSILFVLISSFYFPYPLSHQQLEPISVCFILSNAGVLLGLLCCFCFSFDIPT